MHAYWSAASQEPGTAHLDGNVCEAFVTRPQGNLSGFVYDSRRVSSFTFQLQAVASYRARQMLPKPSCLGQVSF